MKTDVKETTATVTPKVDKAPSPKDLWEAVVKVDAVGPGEQAFEPSPKDLWEAVVKAGHTPSLIEGPGGKVREEAREVGPYLAPPGPRRAGRVPKWSAV